MEGQGIGAGILQVTFLQRSFKLCFFFSWPTRGGGLGDASGVVITVAPPPRIPRYFTPIVIGVRLISHALVFLFTMTEKGIQVARPGKPLCLGLGASLESTFYIPPCPRCHYFVKAN